VRKLWPRVRPGRRVCTGCPAAAAGRGARPARSGLRPWSGAQDSLRCLRAPQIRKPNLVQRGGYDRSW